MNHAEADDTPTSLLRRVADLLNHSAWVEFVGYCEPRLRRWCRCYLLDPDLADELCQRIRIELMRTMPSYRHDPRGSFRAWLWQMFRFRAINLINERRREVAELADSAVLEGAPSAVDDETDPRLVRWLASSKRSTKKCEARSSPIDGRRTGESSFKAKTSVKPQPHWE